MNKTRCEDGKMTTRDFHVDVSKVRRVERGLNTCDFHVGPVVDVKLPVAGRFVIKVET